MFIHASASPSPAAYISSQPPNQNTDLRPPNNDPLSQALPAGGSPNRPSLLISQILQVIFFAGEQHITACYKAHVPVVCRISLHLITSVSD